MYGMNAFPPPPFFFSFTTYKRVCRRLATFVTFLSPWRMMLTCISPRRVKIGPVDWVLYEALTHSL